MDKIFIKMADCPEIQGQWEPSGWDWVYCKTADADDPNPVMLSDYRTDGGYYGHEAPHYGEPQCSSPVSNGAYRKGKYNPNPSRNFKGEHIWLPTQSQLQEMVPPNGVLLDKFESFFYEFFGGFDGVYPCYEMPGWGKHCESWEQLWLSFIMSELHSKKWNGEAWVDAKD